MFIILTSLLILESPAKLPVEASSLSSTETEYADYSSRRFSPVKIDDMKWALFVGDLALNVDRQDLIDLFSQHGTVLDAVVKRASNGNMTKVLHAKWYDINFLTVCPFNSMDLLRCQVK